MREWRIAPTFEVMPSRLRSALVCLAAVAGLVATAHAGAGDEGELRRPDPPATDGMRAQMAQARAEHDVSEARRRTPEARQRRIRSRASYRGLGRAEALGLARRELPEVFADPAFTPIDLPEGAQVERFAGQSGAIVEHDGESELVESVGAPLTSTVGSGSRDFVDLRLRTAGDSFEPRNPIVPLRITDRGVAELPGSDTTIALESADAAEPVAETDGRVFLTGALEDTDLVVTPTPGGVSFAFQVRSAAAPEQAVLSFDLPAGETLRSATGENADAVEVVGPDGAKQAEIVAPSGWDADGEPLDVTYAVDGSRLIVRYPHRDRDLRYPLYVDPIYHDDGYFPSSVGWPEWTYYANANAWNPSLGNPMRLANLAGGRWYYLNEYASYYLQPQRGYISRLEGSYVSHVAQVTCAYMGILSANWSYWKSSWGTCGAATNSFPVVTTGDTAYGDYAMFQFKMNATGRRWAEGRLTSYGARVWLDDRENPTIAGVTNTSSGQWMRGGQQVIVHPSAYDQGLGVRVFNFFGAGNPTSWIRPNTVPTTDSNQACTGVRGARCPQSTVTGAITVSTDNLTEGNIDYGGKAYDALSNGSSNYSTNIKVDRTKPTVTAPGTFYNARNTTIRGAQHSLAVGASDQPGLSGVNRVEIKVNSTVYSVSPGSEWTFSDAVHGPSGASGATPVITPYTIEVTAIDNAGNRSDPVSFQLKWSSQPCDGSPLA
jgi:hypothetical protein